MPKPQYTQKFRSIWLKDPALKNWLTSIDSTAGLQAKCKFCHSLLSNRYADLLKHAQSKKHKVQEKIIVGHEQPKLIFPKNSDIDLARKTEVRISLFVAQHTAINLTDHLTDVCKSSFTDSKSAELLQLHRKKCSGVIKNIIAPHFIKNFMNDMENTSFSLLIDESTDITVHKYLGIVAIYYSKQKNKIISTYLDLSPLDGCTADDIILAIKHCLSKYKLQIKNIIGIGTDNASVMTGVNNGVYAKLKLEVPHLVLIRCVCHSLQLAVSHASKQSLPRNLEFLIQESYNWFSHSSSRQLAYKEIYKTINDSQNPLKIVQACQTRWLSIESAVSRIHEQWHELKTHFNIARMSEKCYNAELLYQMYKDKTNYAFLCFLKPVLRDVQRVNKLFESNDIDQTKLLQELLTLIESLVKQVTIPGRCRNIDIFKVNINEYVDRHCYLGFTFENTVREMKTDGFTEEEEKNLRERCIQFMLNLIDQIKLRLPENIATLKSISILSVDEALKANKKQLTDILKYFGKSNEEIDMIERQWNNINLIKWSETKNTKLFWYEVMAYRDAADDNPFHAIAKFALDVLTMPHANADVERLFSTMNIIKNKLRNRLQLPMLNAILSINAGLKRDNKCCSTYEIPESVWTKVKTNETYRNIDDTEDYIDFTLP